MFGLWHWKSHFKYESNAFLVQHSGSNSSTCKADEIMCISDGHCIESYKFCNGVVDCYDGSDEDRCPDDSGVLSIAFVPLTF